MSSSASVVRSQRRKKLFAVAAFGGKCQVCGYNKCVAALEFHHLGEKKERPQYVILRWAWERAKKELEQCIMVCANCHREIEHPDDGRDIDYRRFIKPFVAMRCEQCDKEFDTIDEEQIYCSSLCSQMAQRKVVRPSKEEMSGLLDAHTTWTQIGKTFGVSDNAARKWAKAYGLINKNEDGVIAQLARASDLQSEG